MIESLSGVAQQFLTDFNLTLDDFKLENYEVLWNPDSSFQDPDSSIFQDAQLSSRRKSPRVGSSEEDFLAHIQPDLNQVGAKWGTENLTPDFGVAPKRSDPFMQGLIPDGVEEAKHLAVGARTWSNRDDDFLHNLEKDEPEIFKKY